jgi:hypothetical protein
MPEANGGDSPAGDPEGEALRQNPRSNLPKQGVMRKGGTDNPDQEEDDSEAPTGKVHWINHATFYLSIILAILTAGTIRVYFLQLQEMIHATKATQDSAYAACMSAKIARGTLLEMQSGEADSHNAAVGTMLQASAAAQGQSGFLALNTGKMISPNSSPDDTNPKNWKDFNNLAFNFANIGRSAIRDFHIAFTVQLLPKDVEPKNMRTAKHLNIQHGGIISPGNSAYAQPIVTDKDGKVIHLDDIPIEDFRLGKFWLVSYGHTEFKDIFGTSHWQTFCGFYDTLPQADPYHPKERHTQCANFNRQDSNLLFSVPAAASIHSSSQVEDIVCIAPKP